MRWAVIVLIILGVIAATSAALLMVTIRSGAQSAATPGLAEVKILVAAKALAAMDRIQAESVEEKTVLKREAPEGCFSDAVQVVGKTLIVHVSAGQAITAECFAEGDVGAGFAAELAPGMRAMSISLDNYSSLESLIFPGLIVDVLLTTNAQEGKEPSTYTILQRVQVLGIDGFTAKSSKEEATRFRAQKPGGLRTVSFQLSHKDASLLQLATGQGKVSLVMRNPRDPTSKSAPPVSLSELLGAERGATTRPALPVQPNGAPQWDMEIFRGDKREMRSFPLP